MARTIFVVGAGASKEFDPGGSSMPVGSELAVQIENAIVHDLESAKGGNLVGVVGAIAQSGYRDEHRTAIKRIRDGILSKPSIDEFIDDWQDFPHLQSIAKMYIARCILEAERNCVLGKLTTHYTDVAAGMRALRDSWLCLIARSINPTSRRRDVEHVFANSAFITFNYDRCIEEFLYHWFTNTQDMSKDRAISALDDIPILHVYGSLGDNLARNNGRPNIPFGASQDYIRAASTSLSTFSETVSDDSFRKIRHLVGSCENIVFLGTAYHRQNLKILFDDKPPENVSIFGTTFGMKAQVCEDIRKRLHGAKQVNLLSGYCRDLLDQYDQELFL